MTGMRATRSRRWRVLAILGLTAALAWWWSAPYVNSAALLLDMTGAAPRLRQWLPVRTLATESQDLLIPTRFGDIAARRYRPVRLTGPTVLIFPGVHGGGVDEPRLVALSRRIAGANATVLSVPLPDLRRYQITTRSTDMIEDVILWASNDRGLAPNGRVGVVGVSFAGGLALVAAGRPSVRGRITALFALGAHADLPRVIRYLCLSAGAPQTLLPPHDYGVVLMLRASVALMVPPEQTAALDRALVTFLDASSADGTDREKAARLFQEAKDAERMLPEPSRSLMHGVNTRDMNALGPLLAPHAERIGGDPSLSPARSPAATAPVFLLHGIDDNVIPSSESIEIDRYLRGAANSNVDRLLTPLLSHAEARNDAGFRATRDLITFWTRMWKAVGRN